MGDDRFFELRYEELILDPEEAVRAIYDRFQWPGYAGVKPAVTHYAKRSKRYRPNRHHLDDGLREEITRRWAPYIQRYGYG